MAKPIQVTVTGVATSSVIEYNYMGESLASANLTVIGGSGCTYTIQYTMDNVQASGYDPSTGTWIDCPVATSQTGNTSVTLWVPVRGLRLNQTIGAATSTFIVLQSGSYQ